MISEASAHGHLAPLFLRQRILAGTLHGVQEGGRREREREREEREIWGG
jgi:hypothetical protein